MFNLPHDEIDYAAVRTFCESKHVEDLDLDYKSDWPEDFARIVCAMANVQGGMILVGVKANSNREPEWPPPGVLGTEDSLRQKVIQICFDGIYPPFQPEIQVCPLDVDPSRSVVVIRIEPSRLLHATDHRRRVYIRVADHSKGYELASLSDLEWLFQQREKERELREFILKRAYERADREEASAMARQVQRDSDRRPIPSLTLYIVPTFPNQPRRMPAGDLLQLAKSLQEKQSPIPGAWQSVPNRINWRTTAQGIYTAAERELEYMELGETGLLFMRRELYAYNGLDSTKRFISVRNTYELCDEFLLYAGDFYREFRWQGPVMFRAAIRNITDLNLDHSLRGQYRMWDMNTLPQDNHAELHAREMSAADLVQDRDSITEEILLSLMWTFGYSDKSENLRNDYLAALRGQSK